VCSLRESARRSATRNLISISLFLFEGISGSIEGRNCYRMRDVMG
jgi:hypothetical protein